jgi:hypothetical protein
MRIRPVLIAGAAGWVKRIPGVILCICIAVLASAGSLYLYSPEPTFRVQSETWSQPYLHQVYDPIHVELETPKKTINQTSLSNFLMSIQSISISDDTPMGQYWIPRNQKYVISQVLTWLKIAAPDTEKIPPLPTVVMAAYLGPSQLHLTTSDKKQIRIIYPAYYYTENKQNGFNQVHYIQDVVVFESEKDISYFKSEQLYNWLKINQWKTEFTPE